MAERAAIFDLDGTLVDSAELHAESWRQLTAELGIAMQDELFARTFGRANNDIIPELLGRPTTPEEVARLSDRKEELYRVIAAEHLTLFDGAAELLAGLHAAGWALAIGSSTPRANLAFAVPHLGLSDLLGAWVGMEDVSRHKPAPDTFLEAARRLAVEPRWCLVFEDAPAGIEAARAAGMRGIAVTTHHPASRFPGATAVVAGVQAVRVADCEGWLEG